MRVLFFTAAALAASLANITSAVRLEDTNALDTFYDNIFSEVENNAYLNQDIAKKDEGQLDNEIEKMEKEVKQMQEQTKREAEKARVEGERTRQLKDAKEQASKTR